jgi:hypothetical protein
MTTETNHKNNMKLPSHLRQWVVQQMVAINLQVLPAELANEFLEFVKEREESRSLPAVSLRLRKSPSEWEGSFMHMS